MKLLCALTKMTAPFLQIKHSTQAICIMQDYSWNACKSTYCTGGGGGGREKVIWTQHNDNDSAHEKYFHIYLIPPMVMSLFKLVTANWPNTTLITWILYPDSVDELHWYPMRLITKYLKIYTPSMLHICYAKKINI
jgi:hypothetical protein